MELHYDGTQDLFVSVSRDVDLLVAGDKFRMLMQVYEHNKFPEVKIPLPVEILPVMRDEGGDPLPDEVTVLQSESWVLESFWWDDLKQVVRGWRKI